VRQTQFSNDTLSGTEGVVSKPTNGQGTTLVLSLESARISTAESVTVQRKALTVSAEVASPA
jgi:hypothetical protein